MTSRPFVSRHERDLALERRQRGGLARADTAIASTRASSSRSRSSEPASRRPSAAATSSALAASTLAARSRHELRGGRRSACSTAASSTPESACLAAAASSRDEGRHGVVGRHARSRFTLYCFATGRANPRSASREAEGTGPMKPRQPGPSGARCQAGRAAARRMVSETTKEEPCLPHTFAVRSCGTEQPLEGGRRLRPLLRAARARLRPRRARATRPASRSRRARRRSGATRRCCRSAPPEPALLAPGLHAARRRAAARGRARRRRALPEARHGQPDALVQGPRRRRRLREGAGARARDARVLVDRQPRERGRRARRGRGAARPRSSARPTSSPRSCVATAAYGATIYAVRGNYDDCSRLTVELSFELPWAFVNVDAARVLRGGLEDARASRSPSSSAGSCRTSSSPRSRRARCSRRSARGFAELARARARRRAGRRG